MVLCPLLYEIWFQSYFDYSCLHLCIELSSNTNNFQEGVFSVAKRSPETILDKLSSVTGLKRKTPKGKLSCQAKLEKYFVKENRDPGGFESQTYQKALGLANIPLQKVNVTGSDFGKPINKKLVDELAVDICSRPDPSQMTITCVPADPDSFSIDAIEEHELIAIQGRHK